MLNFGPHMRLLPTGGKARERLYLESILKFGWGSVMGVLPDNTTPAHNFWIDFRPDARSGETPEPTV